MLKPVAPVAPDTVYRDGLAYWNSICKAIDPATLANFGITRTSVCDTWVYNVTGRF